MRKLFRASGDDEDDGMNCTLDPRRRQQQEGAGGELSHIHSQRGGNRIFVRGEDRLQKKRKKVLLHPKWRRRRSLSATFLRRPTGRPTNASAQENSPPPFLLRYTCAREREHAWDDGGREGPPTDNRPPRCPRAFPCLSSGGLFLGASLPFFLPLFRLRRRHRFFLLLLTLPSSTYTRGALELTSCHGYLVVHCR